MCLGLAIKRQPLRDEAIREYRIALIQFSEPSKVLSMRRHRAGEGVWL
jgi:hypothetical protein